MRLQDAALLTASSTSVRDIDGQRGVEHAKRVGMMVAPDVKVGRQLICDRRLCQVGANTCTVDSEHRKDFGAAQGSAVEA